MRRKRFAKCRYRIGRHIRAVPYVISGSPSMDIITIGNFTEMSNDVVLCPSNGHIPAKEYQHLRVSIYPLTLLKRKGLFGNGWKDSYYLTEKGNQITIGNDVWLGSSVIVLPNVTIGDGAIVGAGAVVTDNLPPYSISVGVPAKVIRFRYSMKQIEALLRIKWWNWSDKKIAENMDLFYGDVNKFISKFDVRGELLCQEMTQERALLHN
ncbi:MAG: CatB-related O-acetyltransferase [Candidatus Bathyarchaeota archaeon]